MNDIRRQVRELALQTLFHIDVGKAPAKEALQATFARGSLTAEGQPLPPEAEATITRYVQGVEAHRAEIDQLLAKLAKEWKPERMANVDRNVLRLAIYEVLYEPETPVGVAINEAVELVKRYSTAESYRFVNGILGSVARLREGGGVHDEGAASE